MMLLAPLRAARIRNLLVGRNIRLRIVVVASPPWSHLVTEEAAHRDKESAAD
jgi:hypothetical protein